MKLERVYIPIWKWEEIDYNMWGGVDNRKAYLRKAIKFTGDHELYGRFMLRVISEWEHSCINALTDYTINRKAWVGHAAAALALGCPEDITREAWGHLTDEQRLLANKKAEFAILQWEDGYRKSIGLYNEMGAEMLF